MRKASTERGRSSVKSPETVGRETRSERYANGEVPTTLR
jgi:hypothetical protein